LELHIEQGPVLEGGGAGGRGARGIVGITWSEVVVTGQADHAGPSPMGLRKDALTAAARIVLAVERLALDRLAERDETAVATVGRFNVEPNVINTIPGRVTFSVDLRHAEPAVLEEQVAALGRIVAEVAAETGTSTTLNRFWTSEPTPFDPDVVATMEASVAELGLDAGRLWSGAGHDAKYLADVCPTGMIFVRSRGGLSHCEQEHSTSEDIAAGADVLLGTALRLAGHG
jgi:N-carbamoyl-L-amino-acid hydrolase